LSGLYTTDEMQQAGTPQTVDVNAEVDDVPTKEERQLLKNLVYQTDLDEDEQMMAFEKIDTCNNYKTYQLIQHRLESRKKPIDAIPNPSQTDIKEHLQKIAS
jgi:GTPase involved in cell partitioning and DNA repair